MFLYHCVPRLGQFLSIGNFLKNALPIRNGKSTNPLHSTKHKKKTIKKCKNNKTISYL